MHPLAPIHIYIPICATRDMPTNWSPRRVVLHHLPETMVLPLSLRDGVERMVSPYGEFSANRPW